MPGLTVSHRLSRLSIKEKGLIVISLLLGAIYIYSFLLFVTIERERTLRDEADRVTRVADESADLARNLMMSLEILGTYHYLRSEERLQEYDDLIVRMQETMARLHDRTSNRPDEFAHFQKMVKAENRLIDKMQMWRQQIREHRSLSERIDPREMISEAKPDVSLFFEEGRQLRNAATKIEKSLPDQHKSVQNMLDILVKLGPVLITLVTGGISYLFYISIYKRLSVISDNCRRLGKKQPLNPGLEGTDEIALVDKTMHEMAAELTRAEQLKQEFFQMISHDIRTPLTSIQGALSLLGKGTYGALNDRGQKRMSNALNNIDYVIKLINELIDYEKIESGMLQLVREETSADDILTRSYEAVRVIAEKKEITIIFPTTDAGVYADADRVMQVFVNLLGNALKFSPDQSSIEITHQRQPLETRFSVKDQGRGIPPEFVDKVFERFQQVKKDDSKAGSGAGLGLAICKAIVEGHGGKIGVVSEPGKGCEFWFTLPHPPAEPLPGPHEHEPVLQTQEKADT